MRDGAVGDHRALFVSEAQRLPDAVKVVVHIVDPEADAVLVVRDRIAWSMRQEADAVAEAEVGVGLRDRPALDWRSCRAAGPRPSR